MAGDDVLRFVGIMLGEVVDNIGTPNDFIGHVGNDDFLVITHKDKASPIVDEAVSRFNEQVHTFYSFMDRERGFMLMEHEGEKKEVPFMSLVCGVVTPEDGPFADIREITEAAAEARRKTTA